MSFKEGGIFVIDEEIDLMAPMLIVELKPLLLAQQWPSDERHEPLEASVRQEALVELIGCGERLIALPATGEIRERQCLP